jgi:phosphoadenosine phosphosulfate reductase
VTARQEGATVALEIRVSHEGKPERIDERSGPGAILDWALQRFTGWQMATTSAFGMEGCALIDMIARRVPAFRVIYIDTHFLFAETYALRDRLAERYPHVRFERFATALTAEEQTRRYGPELWKSEPDLCCRLRKVEPMDGALEDVDIWFTALRRSQSGARRNIGIVDWDWKYQLIKVNPLANWERSDVWNYVKENDVPYNPLHEQGYPTLGCTHCTRRVEGARPDQYTRAGRWPGQNKSACGLHGDGI